MTKKKVAILMGGKSAEHEVSLASGRAVVGSLDPLKFDVLPIVISRDGLSWRLVSRDKILESANPFELKGSDKELIVHNYKEVEGIKGLANAKLDVIFIAMHGPYGEDGTVQGMLELTGIPYTGSGVMASSIGMNKLVFRKLLSSQDILLPKYWVVKKEDSFKSSTFPVVVKPHNQGSSVGIKIVNNQQELDQAIGEALDYSDTVLVDEYIKGTEITCGVLGNDKPFALPLVEIIPKNSFFDYESKYLSDDTQEISPARINEDLTKKIQATAVEIYKLLECRGFARVDFILRGEEAFVLEINTIPGLTPMSLLPKAASAAGMSYAQLIEKIINFACEK